MRVVRLFHSLFCGHSVAPLCQQLGHRNGVRPEVTTLCGIILLGDVPWFDWFNCNSVTLNGLIILGVEITVMLATLSAALVMDP